MTPLSSAPMTVGAVIDFIRSRCVLPESREPMELHPYQLDLVEKWHDPSGKADVTVIAAGNAKTTTLGAYVTARLFLGLEESVPVVADTVTQAVLTTWGRVKRFVELNPELAERAEVLEGQGSRRGIYVPGMGSHCFPIADKPSGLQGLNPSRAVLEEMSEASTATFGALMNRLGKRPDSKLLGISTPSFTPDNALLSVELAVDGGNAPDGVTLTRYRSEQADHRDESGWCAANPGLPYGLPDIGAIRTDLLLPEQQFRAYRLCQWPKGSQSCWLNALDDAGEELGDAYEVWQRGASPWALREGSKTWVGVDVAKSHDHAACVWGQFRDDGRLHVVAKVWTPTADATIDLDEIGDHLRYLCGRYDVRTVLYDPSYFWNAPALAAEGLPMVEVPPTEQRMAPIVGHAYREVRRGRVTHSDQEELTLHVLAAKRRYGARGFTLEKRHVAVKIDAAIALVLCHAAATNFDDSPSYTLDSFKVL